MTDKIIVITGANSGIGEATVRDMIARNAIVVMACRDIVSANKIKRNTCLKKLKFNNIRIYIILLNDHLQKT